MSNKIETVSIGDLPIATELDDADELLLRDVSATLPENATARLSIATLRAAMGGGSPDRIESASGDAFVESTDDFLGEGIPGSIMVTESNGASARVATYADPGNNDTYALVSVGPEGDIEGGAGFGASYNATSDAYALSAHGAPLQVEEPIESSHAATKGYVDARPGAEEWSEHPATQDVDLDGHKITGLGEPTEEDDAATKGYVDAVSPTKIERSFSWGRSVAEVTDDGDVDLAVYLSGQTAPLRRVRVPHGGVGSGMTMISRSGMGGTDWVTELILSTGSPAFRFALSGGPSGGASARGGVSFAQGVWRFTERNGAEVRLGSEGYYALPSGVSSIKHGVHLAKQAHDRRADIEWWDPTWTPVENVDSVSNVECQYTRTYRAAGGSLVTLEGTIEVTPEAAGGCAVEADIPLPVTGSTGVTGVASAADSASVYPAYSSLVNGKVRLIFSAASSDEHVVPFRLSYRAA